VPLVKDKYRGKKEYLLAHAALVLAANSRSFLTYTGIARLTGLPEVAGQLGQTVGHLLGEIGEDEHSLGRPILTALVVDKTSGAPSYGFYKLTDALELTKGYSKTEKKEFMQKEQTKLFKFYE
jgi:hypothetical protein